MKDHLVAWTMCPYCGTLVDAAANLDSDRLPADGDAAVCIECAAVSIWDSTFLEGRRLPTESEETTLNATESVMKAVALVREFLASKRAV